MNKLKNGLKWIGIAFLSVLIVYLLAALILIAVSACSDTGNTDSGTAAASWMSMIDDDTSMAMINIPGTHDSTTQYTPFHYSFQCQNTSVKEQLLMGYRFFDIRLDLSTNSDGNKVLNLMHGIGHCKNADGSYMTFEDFEEVCIDFLKEYPTEVIIVMVDSAGDRAKYAVSVSEVLQEQISESADYWYLKNTVPRLEEVRGQMILATRFGDVNGIGESLCGWDLEWQSQASDVLPENAFVTYAMNDAGDFFTVQNWYHLLPDDKWTVFKEALEAGSEDENTLMINYLTVSRGILFLPCPKLRALNLNERLASCSMSAGEYYGIVIIDFASADLAEQIYMTNSCFCDDRSQ